MFNFVLAKLSEISSYIISFPYPIILYSMKKLEEEFRFTHTLRNCKKKQEEEKLVFKNGFLHFLFRIT